MPFLSDETRCLCSGTLSTPSGRYYWTNPIITLNSSGTATGPAPYHQAPTRGYGSNPLEARN